MSQYLYERYAGYFTQLMASCSSWLFGVGEEEGRDRIKMAVRHAFDTRLTTLISFDRFGASYYGDTGCHDESSCAASDSCQKNCEKK